MTAPPDLISSITWWETATIWTTVAAAFAQSVSWVLSFVAYYRKKRPQSQSLAHLDDKASLEGASLNLAGFAAVVALAGAFCSIRYAHLADQDSLQVHRQLTDAQLQSASDPFLT
jgi:hypothetical protein